MYRCQIFLRQIQNEIETSTFAMLASWTGAQTYLFTSRGMQYRCRTEMHKEIDRYANVDND